MSLDRSSRNIARLNDQIRSNEKIWAAFRDIELGVIGCQSLHELIKAVADGLYRNFPNVDCVTLACIDPEYELTRMIKATEMEGIWKNTFLQIQPEHITEVLLQRRDARLGECDARLQSLLFPSYKRHIASFASAPLRFQGELIGLLSQGSRNPIHFTAGKGTDFLEHLCAVTAVCIDNVIVHEKLKHAGFTDPLTGLFNRRYFDNRLHEHIERWERYHTHLSCIFFDIDRFKQINDKYGHHVGDLVLQRISNLLGADLRTSDVLARFGGEEFVMLLPDIDLAVATDIAERLRHNVETAVFDDIVTGLEVTTSVGVASLADETAIDKKELAKYLLECADTALYQAKEGGRNRVVVAHTR